ncbi:MULTISPECIES: DUF3244 domain-containing protein [Sphingobacterium]|jgi:Domain of unknown function (DUF3244)|uniref:DUF3244 domain-containing protein n=1 Tax=Sphingobacterium TaxID=28453 RepID=UPI000969334D|nr:MULTISPECIES: DUF3244 domain-containing protein [Sphingobacterium]OJZ01390.1 MAG: hypothetical protein BGP15_18515 [Sphingobacterium sp. 40-24]HAF36497.1 DUF3244 domain-containing protein [Sphingobacterium sp.]
MKKQILLIALLSGVIAAPALGSSQIAPVPNSALITQSDEIDLRGRIEPGEIRRIGSAVSAFLETTVIRSQFHFDGGTLQISIANATGTMVYNQTVSTSIGEFLIPISGFTSGNYSITFTSTSGEVTGDFVL